MLRSKLGIAVLAVGLLAVGFGLGQYLEARANAREASLRKYGPEGPPPPYTGQATFTAEDIPFDPMVLARPEPGTLLEVLADPDAFHRAARLGELLPRLGPEALPHVRTVLESPRELTGMEILLLARFWATHAPLEAANWAVSGAPIMYRAPAFVAVIEPWARQDAQAASKMVKLAMMSPGTDLSAGERVLVETWFETGQPGLETYMRDLGIGLERQRALLAFFTAAVRRDGPALPGRWAESLPDDDVKFKLDAFRKFGAVLARLHPPAAVTWCETHCEGRFGLALRRVVAENWARNDGRSAMEWLATAPENQDTKVALNASIRAWAMTDYEGLERWLDTKGPEDVEPWLIPAAPVIAATILGRQPAKAMRWAEHEVDPDTRTGSLVALAREWGKRDPDAAEAWLASSSLSEEDRELARTAEPSRAAAGQR